MKLTAARRKWTNTTAWTLWLKRESIGSVWNDRDAWGWRVRGTGECYYAATRDEAALALARACGITDAIAPEVWP